MAQADLADLVDPVARAADLVMVRADPADHLQAAVGDHLQVAAVDMAAAAAADGDAEFSAARSIVAEWLSTDKVATCRKRVIKRCGIANALAVSAGWMVAIQSSASR